MILRIAISTGDPAGIGPEVTVKALAAAGPGVLFQIHGPRLLYETLASELRLVLPSEQVQWVEIGPVDLGDCRSGRPGSRAGELQVRSLVSAVDAVLAGRADALCTAPITKAAARAAGLAFPGHTEYLAHRAGAKRVAMMLAGPALRVVPITGHLPLRQVAGALQVERVADVLLLAAEALQQDFGLARPRVALAALNPHAGEQGLLGDEERTILAPGLERARRELAARGLPAMLDGPWPADGLFAHHDTWDAVVCCYHDQALIPLKLLHRDEGVNFTLGLPFVRTSPAHGSALDIAGQNVARAESMAAALSLAATLAMRRSRFT